MNELIWYSWLGGIIIGTMIGANMVLEEHCRAGPRNVVITGRFSPLSCLPYSLVFLSPSVHAFVSVCRGFEKVPFMSLF